MNKGEAIAFGVFMCCIIVGGATILGLHLSVKPQYAKWSDLAIMWAIVIVPLTGLLVLAKCVQLLILWWTR